MSKYIGIDMGSTTISAVLIDTEKCDLVAKLSAANECETTRAQDKERGYSEWDILAMSRQAVELLKELVAKHGGKETDGIGVTGQQHGVVLVDENDEPLSPFIGWQDRRCLEEADGATTIDRMLALGGEMLADTGCVPATGYMASTMLWLKEQDALPPDVHACFAPDFLVSYLTDTEPVTDPTLAASSGAYHVTDGRWHGELIEALGLDEEYFPVVEPACTKAAGLGESIHEYLGLPKGVPVAVPCGDNQASFVGSVAEPDETVLVNIGTGGLTSAFVSEPLRVEGVDLRPHVQGGYLLVGAGLSGGRAFQLLRDFVQEVGRRVFRFRRDPGIYAGLLSLAKDVDKGSDGLRCVPTFAGTRDEPDQRATWSGMGETNFTPGHMARALFEGMAEQYHGLYEAMVEAGVGERGKLIGSGNGIRNNDLMADIVSEAFGLELKMPRHAEEAAVGAALTAAVTVGEYESIVEASRAFRVE